jgi:tetratricopeptide (TPR) repeat protein
LFGVGGVGKTQTAIEYAYRFEQFYHEIFWVSAVDQASLLSGFQEIAKLTCLPVDACATPMQIAKTCLSWFRERATWLLIIDNLDDISVVNELLPDNTNGGHTIITTRNPNSEGIPAEGMEVGVLNVAEAQKLLLKLSKVNLATNRDTKEEEAAQIVREVGCLALAIEQAAAFIRETSRDISQFLPIYADNRKALLGRAPHGNRTYPHTVRTTWRMSFTLIHEENREAALLLRLFAFLNPDFILLEFLRACVKGWGGAWPSLISNSLNFEEALFVLEKFSLIKRVQNGRGISMHRLVQAVIKDDMEQDRRCKIWEVIITMFSNALPLYDFRDRYRRLVFRDQVIEPLLSCELESEMFCAILSRVASFLADEGRLIQAKDMQLKACLISERLVGKEHPQTLAHKELLVSIYDGQGRFQDEASLLEDILQVKRRVLGDDSRETLTTALVLAKIYQRKQEKFAEAKELLEWCFERLTSVHGRNHPETLRVLAALSSVLWDQGKDEEAIEILERVLQGRTECLGEEHPDTLLSLANLAFCHAENGRVEQARALEERLASMRPLWLSTTYTRRISTNMCMIYPETERGADVLQVESGQVEEIIHLI